MQAKKRKVIAVRKRTKKRLLAQMKKAASTSSTTNKNDLLDSFGSSGLRKRRTMYASERPSKQHKTPNASLATHCAHRVCVLDTQQQQMRAILQEIRVVQAAATNKRVKPKIVLFVQSPKHAADFAQHLPGKVGFIHSSDPTTTDKVLRSFQSGKISICIATDDSATTTRLYEQRNTISAVFGASPPLSSAAILCRCTLAAKAVNGNYGDYALSATFCLKTKAWQIAAKLILANLDNYSNVIVTPSFNDFAASLQ